MKLYGVFRQYLYNETLMAVMQSKSNAELLAEKWGCKVKTITMAEAAERFARQGHK